MRTYYLFESLKACTEKISEINSRKNYQGATNTWCVPHKNQTEENWIIPYDPQQISDCLDLLDGYEELTQSEAEKRGWYFGVFYGSLAREREKLEDMHFTFDALVESYGRPNFPATRSEILTPPHNLIKHRVVDFANSWIFNSSLYKNPKKQDKFVHKQAEYLLYLFYPYLTNKGKEEIELLEITTKE